MRRLATAAALATLMGCAPATLVRPAAAPVIAVLYDDLFLGELQGLGSGRGSVTVESKLHSSVRCIGVYQRETALAGGGDMRCNDGALFVFRYQALTATTGYGFGNSPRGPMTFTWGMTPEQSIPYLKLPAGRTIRSGPKGPEITTI